MDRARDDLAGVIFVRSLWWTYAIAGGLYVVSRTTAAGEGSATTTLVATLAVVGSAAPPVALAAYVGRPRVELGPIPIPVVYALSLLATTLGAATWWLVSAALGDAPTIDLRLVLDVLVVGPIWIVLIGGGVVLWQSERQRRAAARLQLAALERFADAATQTARTAEETVMIQAGEQMRSTLAGLPDPDSLTLDDAAAWRRVAGDLRRATDEVIRPLSHSLWATSAVPHLRRPFSWVWRIVTTQDFRPGLIAAVFVAGSVTQTLTIYGVAAGTVLLVLEVAAIFVILGGANLVMRRVRRRAPVYLAALLIIEVLPLLPWPSVLGPSPVPTVGERVVGIIASVLLILITSGVGLVRQATAARAVDTAYRLEQAEERESQEAVGLAVALREVGSRLHGQVQAQLSAAAIAIDEAASLGRWSDAVDALDRARTALAAGVPQTTSGSLSQALDRVSDPWRAVGDVEVGCRVDDSVDPDTAARIAQIVEVGVTNAFRHGQATRVRVEVDREQTGVTIRVQDDGTGVAELTPGQWGLGLSLVDTLTEGDWSIGTVDAGTLLTARLPVVAPP